MVWKQSCSDNALVYEIILYFPFSLSTPPSTPLTLSCVTEFGLCSPLSLIGRDSLEAVFSPKALAGKKKKFLLESLFWTKTEIEVVCPQHIRYLC